MNLNTTDLTSPDTRSDQISFDRAFTRYPFVTTSPLWDQDSLYQEKVDKMMTYILERCTHLQTLLFSRQTVNLFFQTVVDGKRLPYGFLTKSLKRIYFPYEPDPAFSISGRNAIFILVFCQGLEKAVLSFFGFSS